MTITAASQVKLRLGETVLHCVTSTTPIRYTTDPERLPCSNPVQTGISGEGEGAGGGWLPCCHSNNTLPSQLEERTLAVFYKQVFIYYFYFVVALTKPMHPAWLRVNEFEESQSKKKPVNHLNSLMPVI